jgi:actin-related protein
LTRLSTSILKTTTSRRRACLKIAYHTSRPRYIPTIMAPTAGQRRTKSWGPPPPPQTLIIDNGAYTIKAGFSSPGSTSEAKIIPNCLARDREKRVYIGSQLEKCKDFGEIIFRRPVEKGYIVNWEAQKEIWEHEFFESKSPLRCDPGDTGLILTEAPNSFPQLQQHADEMVFEGFGFASYLRTTRTYISSRFSYTNSNYTL